MARDYTLKLNTKGLNMAKDYTLKLNTKGGPDWNGSVWSVWDSQKFIGYVEKRTRPIAGFSAFALAPDLTFVGKYETREIAAKAVMNFHLVGAA